MSETRGRVERRVRGGDRRSATVARAAILTAASELLLEDGLAAITFEKVASRANASKTTLYKWWSSPGALALEAYFAAVKPRLAFPDTGDLEADLTSQLAQFVTLLTTDKFGHALAQLIGAAQTDPALAAAYAEHYSRPRRRLAVERFELSRERGEIPADLDLEVLVDQLWGACYHRLLLPDQPLDVPFTRALIRNLLYGITPRRP